MTTIQQSLPASISETLRMQEYMPRLYKINALCDDEKNRMPGSIGGIKKSYKLLVLTEQAYHDITTNSNILLDIIHKEYPELSCRLTSVQKVRDITISTSLVDKDNPCKIDTTNRAVSELCAVVCGSHVEDPVFVIGSYDLNSCRCNYGLINSRGLHLDSL